MVIECSTMNHAKVVFDIDTRLAVRLNLYIYIYIYFGPGTPILEPLILEFVVFESPVFYSQKGNLRMRLDLSYPAPSHGTLSIESHN